MRNPAYALCFFSFSCAISQTIQLTPVTDIGTRTVAVTVPPKFTGEFPSGRILRIPANYDISVFHAGGLTKPRFMAFDPKGVLHVSDHNSGKIFALPDADNNGAADTIREVAGGFYGNHDVKFYKGAMYVTEPTRVWKCTDLDADGVYETKVAFITNIGGNQLHGHSTRTLVFDSVSKKAYVSVGSSCNVCRETDRAIIEQYDENGTNRKIYARGVRNAVGMAMHPATNRLWANNNGSDQQGNEIPPEWIDIVRPDGFYGHPFVYGTGTWFDFNVSDYQGLKPVTAADSADAAKLVKPAALIRAHSAPMAFQFLNSMFGTTMQHGFLTALRGSWNTTNPADFRGYKVIYSHLSGPQDTTVDYVADFCAGFITDTVNRIYWGRPVGLAVDKTGKVYISSDEGSKVILVMTPHIDHTGFETNLADQKRITLFPNPARQQVTVSFTDSRQDNFTLNIYDITGKEVASIANSQSPDGDRGYVMSLKGIAPGFYTVRVCARTFTETVRLVIID